MARLQASPGVDKHPPGARRSQAAAFAGVSSLGLLSGWFGEAAKQERPGDARPELRLLDTLSKITHHDEQID